ncbi:DUF2955 domain-containing protein [Vibrio sp. 404]|uniref:DUF2955 domain-containing protein n=1 Tax=Vibrio marinisediminis TaxID=2758441 RepID=A0A7W2FNH0_9VIBR|nr:DUF2955 domain-containing protein [Vibrio marinisediminis]MBA5761217.1 DUF2955 domain-containing protein [Vibrio marinisediminis]
MFRFDNNSQRNEAIRVTLSIAVCMLLGKLLGLSSAVYLALYPTIIMTKCKDYSWMGLARVFLPTLLAASTALVVSNTFYDHPFIIWTISLLFFDWMRRRATTPAKMGAMLMPTFNWILVIVFAQHTSADMTTRIHEILISMMITALVCKAFVALFPIASKGKPPSFKESPVTAQQRLLSVSLIGIGVGFLLQVDMLSATFCMVPVIAASLQCQAEAFRQVIERRFITQVGGCALASIFTMLLSGHQSIWAMYALLLVVLIFSIASLMVKADVTARDVHADALLATMLPIQLYLGVQEMGLERTMLRGWQLAVTLGILYLLYQLFCAKRPTLQATQTDSN